MGPSKDSLLIVLLWNLTAANAAFGLQGKAEEGNQMAEEQAIVDHSSNSPEKVDGGCLPDWELAELPAPPPFQFGRAFRGVLGPGIIALGASIGSGEWLLGPKITVQYGGTLLWIATIAIVLQSILNTES